jgi:hypothetical protein
MACKKRCVQKILQLSLFLKRCAHHMRCMLKHAQQRSTSEKHNRCTRVSIHIHSYSNKGARRPDRPLQLQRSCSPAAAFTACSAATSSLQLISSVDSASTTLGTGSSGANGFVNNCDSPQLLSCWCSTAAVFCSSSSARAVTKRA